MSAAIHWLLVYQQRGGDWRADAAAPQDLSNANWEAYSADVTQTAWAVLALIAAGRASDPATCRAVQYLIDAQQENGEWWADRSAGGSTSQKNGLSANHLEATAWPLIALSEWAVSMAALQQVPQAPPALRLIAAEADE
jgi:squalene-hopene/tetraprenyl-beta-curcumene cyclase